MESHKRRWHLVQDPSRKTLQFDKKDRERIKDYSRNAFKVFFSKTYPEVSFDIVNFDYPKGWFIPRPCRVRIKVRQLDKRQIKNLEKILERYGFDENFRGIVKWALSISSYKLDRDVERLVYANWFTYLFSAITPQLKSILLFDSSRGVEWRNRLKVCKKGWEDVAVPEDSGLRLTQELLKDEFGKTVTMAKIEGRYRRWIAERESWRFTFHTGKKKGVVMETIKGKASLKKK